MTGQSELTPYRSVGKPRYELSMPARATGVDHNYGNFPQVRTVPRSVTRGVTDVTSCRPRNYLEVTPDAISTRPAQVPLIDPQVAS